MNPSIKQFEEACKKIGINPLKLSVTINQNTLFKLFKLGYETSIMPTPSVIKLTKVQQNIINILSFQHELLTSREIYERSQFALRTIRASCLDLYHMNLVIKQKATNGFKWGVKK